jgi:hypothetical protein
MRDLVLAGTLHDHDRVCDASFARAGGRRAELARLRSPFVATPPVHLRVARIAFWCSVFALCALIAFMLVAFVVWVLVVDWQVLDL